MAHSDTTATTAASLWIANIFGGFNVVETIVATEPHLNVDNVHMVIY